ncbi:MAG: enoyl-CoA hydratase/isomerase family protein [Pseudomonadota bacterium]
MSKQSSTAKQYESILLRIEQSVATLTLNQAERHNVFDERLIAELTEALRQLDEAQNVRVVVIAATGKSFCAGADLNWMKRAAAYSASENLRDAYNLATLLSTLNSLSKPTIARIQGSAYGGGLGLIAACDIAVATSDALFSLSEVKLGIIPALISPYVLAAIGERHSRRYMLTAERFSASEAQRIGLLHETVSNEAQLDTVVATLSRALCNNGPHALAECKSLILSIAGEPIDDSTIEETAQRITRVRASAEGQEGLSAFLEKRSPKWVQLS